MSIAGKISFSSAVCQIIWMPWLNDYEGVKNQLINASVSFDLSNHIVDSVQFSKNMNSPAGSFFFKLDNSKQWDEFIKPGQWCLIFMTQNDSISNAFSLSVDPNLEGLAVPSDVFYAISQPHEKILTPDLKYLRGICKIDRISYNGSVVTNGALDLTFEVSGRDMGSIYQDTNLWYNYFVYDQLKVEAMNAYVQQSNYNSIDNLLSFVHDLFFAPEKVIKKEALHGNNGVTSLPKQFTLPNSLFNVLPNLQSNVNNAEYFGNLSNLLNFSPTNAAFWLYNVFSVLQGTAWDQLKVLSIPSLHELFFELSDTGYPKLIFRPISWGIDNSAYPDLAKGKRGIQTYLNYATNNNIPIPSEDVISFNLGRDNQNRYNHFLVQYDGEILEKQTTIAQIKNQSSPGGRQFPDMDTTSIALYGFKPKHISANTFFTLQALKGELLNSKAGAPNTNLLLQYNEVIRDYWYQDIYFETGSLVIKGNNSIKIGKCIYFSDKQAASVPGSAYSDQLVPQLANKFFYIEGYTDSFTIDANGTTSWTQTLQLTRGIDKNNLQSMMKLKNNEQAKVQYLGSYVFKMGANK